MKFKDMVFENEMRTSFIEHIDVYSPNYEGVVEIYKVKRKTNRVLRITNSRLFRNIPLVKQLEDQGLLGEKNIYLTNSSHSADVFMPFDYFSNTYIDNQVYSYLDKTEINQFLQTNMVIDWLILFNYTYLGKLFIKGYLDELKTLSRDDRATNIERIVKILNSTSNLNRTKEMSSNLVKDFPELKLWLLNI